LLAVLTAGAGTAVSAASKSKYLVNANTALKKIADIVKRRRFNAKQQHPLALENPKAQKKIDKPTAKLDELRDNLIKSPPKPLVVTDKWGTAYRAEKKSSESISASKYSNLKKMDPGYLAEELGMAKAWEPFGAEVEYLTPEELSKFEVKVVNHKLVDFEGVPVDSGDANNGKVMFVMDSSGKIYAGKQRVMEFHHSSFLAGEEVASAGELMVFDGEILSHSRKSGHYKPTPEQHEQFVSELKFSGIDLSNIAEDEVE